MTDVPLPWNGGGFLLLLILAAVWVASRLAPHPSPWHRPGSPRATSSTPTRPATPCIFPFESCGCSHDRVFHASGVGGCDRPGCGCRGFHLLSQHIA